MSRGLTPEQRMWSDWVAGGPGRSVEVQPLAENPELGLWCDEKHIACHYSMVWVISLLHQLNPAEEPTVHECYLRKAVYCEEGCEARYEPL